MKFGNKAKVLIVKKGDWYIKLSFCRVFRFIIALLSLNVSIEKMYQIICG